VGASCLNNDNKNVAAGPDGFLDIYI
jgi:hypothetical protein